MEGSHTSFAESIVKADHAELAFREYDVPYLPSEYAYEDWWDDWWDEFVERWEDEDW